MTNFLLIANLIFMLILLGLITNLVFNKHYKSIIENNKQDLEEHLFEIEKLYITLTQKVDEHIKRIENRYNQLEFKIDKNIENDIEKMLTLNFRIDKNIEELFKKLKYLEDENTKKYKIIGNLKKKLNNIKKGK